MACLKTTLTLCLLGLVMTSLADDTGSPVFCKGCDVPIEKCSLRVKPTTGYSYMGPGFKWLKPLSGSGTCAKQGVLQLDPPTWAKSLTLRLTFSNPTKWSFNLGDSESNNGYAGDSGHHSHGYAAEVHNIGSKLFVYKNDLPMCNRCEKMYILPDIITSQLVITVSHDQLCIYNGDGVTIFKISKCLFNFDRMFLGINRVIHNRFVNPSPYNRHGSGLCNVCGAWSDKTITDP